MWRRDNQRRIERIVVYDPRSLATVWVLDEETNDYIAVPYRVPHPDMTLSCPRFFWTPICPTGGSYGEVWHEQDHAK